MDDRDYMSVALSHAKKGAGKVNPNPMVGAVIVRDGRIIAVGHHDHFGGWHAERAALEAAKRDGVDVRGATIYVTLEPCCHQGKQPPCSQALIDAGIARVVVGSADPNPLVAGKGIRQLREAGIEVTEDVLRDECDALNEIFMHYIVSHKPFVLLKYAMTADGKIATRTGASRWITGEAARHRVHEDRGRFAAIMVGVGTVIADDPQLTCRLGDGDAGDGRETTGHNPLRIVCDSRLRTPLDSALVRTAHDVPTIIATCVPWNEPAAKPYADAGCEVLTIDADAAGHVDVNALATVLGSRGIDSVIVEGGASLAWAALRARIVTKIDAYVAPKIFGGASAPTPVGGDGVETPADCFRLTNTTVETLGDDLLIEGLVRYDNDDNDGSEPSDADDSAEEGEDHVHGNR
ncbi:riboflavin biosynthesis protein RibD [Bifidobacterium primatium]|uniref:Riboflavin biosynthesis protein RibD n=2 Tax=Bifidobacterium TaxID=1678 RepID=A0A2M9HBU8_9BIFI|nr:MULTISPECIES: bifunctional diaminohydroxyphosphoribosylaminopyrimidine deaminase/5-amino-6-(5-phosphoribosylamino)uracil reductase RibD [Bifidobacterium]NEG96525.1 bifunctional diaminohydroxyphosphoribosylaminopyrimidine deaminase/5-amino-6-(5-phosphoribosylamino)uracil reductase RibD [Bifidobacterium sp. SMB2]NEH10558.1 bifunctional diaminohydroxyphosphoribosylaminopyrimidine deaminase/5-amino-6-(5-phosphoribosylamino)uracil reductase RibD [Bifidobacterium saimiriisciurei]NEH10659.1 bifuncti